MPSSAWKKDVCRSEEHTSELQSLTNLVCRLLLEKNKTYMRIIDGSVEIARHPRANDRHQLVLDPAHQEAVLKIKRKAFHSTPGGRLEQAVPESTTPS